MAWLGLPYELPDSIKALEIRDFHFDIDAAGWISFRSSVAS